MHVYNASELSEQIGHMVKGYLWRAPREVQDAFALCVVQAMTDPDNDNGDTYIVLDSSWACGLAVRDVSDVESADIVREAAGSYVVQKAIEAEIKRLLERYGYVVAVEE